MAQVGSKAQKREGEIASAQQEENGALLHRLRWVTLHVPRRLLLGLLLFGIALGFNLYRLGAPSIWFDEAFSVELARQPLPLLWHIIFGPEPNMELYYLFLHYWLALTSLLGLLPTEFVVRFPSAIFAALSTVVVFLLGQRFISAKAGVLGAILYLLSNLQLVYAQQTRAYSLQLLLICIAWYAMLAVLTSTAHSRRWWACYVLAMTLAIYTHLFSLLILLAQLVTMAGILLVPNLWWDRARKQLAAWSISVLAIGVLSIPMFLVAREGAKTGWLPAPSFDKLAYLFLMISGNSKLYLLAIGAYCAMGVIIVFLRSGGVDKSGRNKTGPYGLTDKAGSYGGERPVVWAWLCWFAVPLVVSFVVSSGSLRLFSERYLVTIVPPLFLLVGAGVMVLRGRAGHVVQVALALGLVALALVAVPGYYRSAQVEDWNAVTHWLQQRYQPGDGLICYDNSLEQECQVSVEYYLHAYPNGAHFTEDAPGSFSWSNLGPANPASGPDAAVDPRVLAAYGAKHPRIFFIVGRVRDEAAAARAQAARQWLDGHYHRVAQIVTRTVTIDLYETSASR